MKQVVHMVSRVSILPQKTVCGMPFTDDVQTYVTQEVTCLECFRKWFRAYTIKKEIVDERVFLFKVNHKCTSHSSEEKCVCSARYSKVGGWLPLISDVGTIPFYRGFGLATWLMLEIMNEFGPKIL